MSDLELLRWSDVWLLTAIYQTSGEAPADLVAVIAAADFINHAVPNPEELESGLFRLRQAGLIVEIDERLRFQCTPEALATIEDLAAKTASVHDLRKGLEQRLRVGPWAPGEPLPHPQNSHHYPGFSSSTYQGAIQRYLKKMRSR